MKTKKIIITFFFIFISIALFGQKYNTVQFLTSAQCNLCKDRIENELIYTKGITKANIDVNTKIATVSYKTKKITEQQIINIMLNLGYDVNGQTGNQTAYQNLPNCCKKPQDRK